VTSGFEHSVANMYFMAIALFIKQWADPAFWQMTGLTPSLSRIWAGAGI